MPAELDQYWSHIREESRGNRKSFRLGVGLFFRSVLCLFFVGPLAGFSQELNDFRFSVQDGLPSAEVYQIKQDQNNFYWIATDRGVSRFDGITFETFTTHDGLCNNTIFNIFPDQNGRIWFSGHTGCLSYYEHNAFHPYAYNDTLLKYLHGEFPNSIYVDRNRNVYINGSYYSFVVDSLGNLTPQAETSTAFNTLSLNWDIGEEHVQRSMTSGDLIDHVKWVKGNDTLYYDLDGQRVEVHNTSSLDVISHDSAIIVAADTVVFILTPNGNVSSVRLTDVITNGLYLDKNNSLWVGTYDGCYEFKNMDLTSKPVRHFKGLPISSIYVDQEKGHWFSTLNDGLRYIPHRPNRFIEIPKTFKDQFFNYVFLSNGGIYIASSTGQVLKLKDAHFEPSHLFHQLLDVIYDSEREEVLLFSTFSTYKWNNKGEVLDLGYLGHNGYIDKSGRYIFFNRGGLGDRHLWVVQTQNLDTLHRVPKTSFAGGLNSSSSKSGLFLSSVKSTFRWDYKTEKLTDMKLVNPYFNNRIFEQKQFYEFNLFTSAGQGVLLYKEDHNYEIGTKHGLISDYCDELFIDENVVWLGSGNGLSKVTFDPQNRSSYKITNYTSGSGLKTNEIRGICRFKDVMLILNPTGLNLIPVQDRMEQYPLPKAAITRVSRVGDNENLLPDQKLKYNENNITVWYGASTVRFRNELLFECLLIGSDTQRFLTTNREIRFFDLAPGNYSFSVRSSLKHGGQTGVEDHFSFEVIPAFWQTSWFKVLLAALLVFLSVGISYYVINQRRKKVNLLRLNEISELKAEVANEKLEREKLATRHLKESFDSKNREMVSLTMMIGEKNAVLQAVRNKIKMLRSTSRSERSKSIQELLSVITQSGAKEKNWDTFLQHFNTVHPKFIDNLRSNYPDLTSGELKYCAYIKINLSNKDVASLLNVTPKAVDMAKYRIRKKMGLKAEERLSTFLFNRS